MSQEIVDIETATEEQILGAPESEVQEEPAAHPEEPTAKVEENRVPLEHLIQERQARQRLEQELHAVRIAALQAMTPQASQEDDPVEVAMGRIAKKAGWDDTLSSVLGPTIRPVIEELAYLRRVNDAAMAKIEAQEAQLARLSEREQAQAQNQELARIIPDLDRVGPKMLELLKDMPPEVQQQYAANPRLLIPLANAVRSTAPAAAAPRMKPGHLGVDTGAPPSTPLSFTEDSLASVKPNSKEFAAMARNFFGGDFI